MSSWRNQDFGPEKKKVKMKVEYERTPIRHLAVQCPDCESWFIGVDIFKNSPRYSYELTNAQCHCPKCGSDFVTDCESEISTDVSFPEFYNNCLKQKTTWE